MFAEAAGVGFVGGAAFEAVGAVEADGELGAVGGLDAEAVAVGPVGGKEAAVGEELEGLVCGGGEDEGEQEGS